MKSKKPAWKRFMHWRTLPVFNPSMAQLIGTHFEFETINFEIDNSWLRKTRSPLVLPIFWNSQEFSIYVENQSWSNVNPQLLVPHWRIKGWTFDLKFPSSSSVICPCIHFSAILGSLNQPLGVFMMACLYSSHVFPLGVRPGLEESAFHRSARFSQDMSEYIGVTTGLIVCTPLKSIKVRESTLSGKRHANGEAINVPILWATQWKLSQPENMS